MLGFAKIHRLPEYFKNDLNQDLQILNSFEDCRFIWLLRTFGSVLFPLEGAIFERTNLESSDFRTATHFTIDPEKNRLKKAKFSKEGVLGLLKNYDIVVEDS